MDAPAASLMQRLRRCRSADEVLGALLAEALAADDPTGGAVYRWETERDVLVRVATGGAAERFAPEVGLGEGPIGAALAAQLARAGPTRTRAKPARGRRKAAATATVPRDGAGDEPGQVEAGPAVVTLALVHRERLGGALVVRYDGAAGGGAVDGGAADGGAAIGDAAGSSSASDGRERVGAASNDRGRLATLADVVAPVLAAELLADALAGAERRLESVTLAVRGLAHDLNNDLTMPIGALELLRDRPELSDDARALVEASAEDLARIEDRIRTFQQRARSGAD